MGALAPVATWIPEDDLLLKNAVEAGASLESLAKGAVQFSRKFTVRELQERWRALLYDPVISEQAAFRMIELDRSSSTIPSRCNKSGNSKENKCFFGKRKTETIRGCYYAMRKRIRSEPINSMGMSFLVEPSDDNYIGNEDEPISRHCMLDNPVSNHLGLEESDLDIVHHALAQIGDGDAAPTFHTQVQHTVQEHCPMELDTAHNKILQIYGENASQTKKEPGVEEFHQPNELQASSNMTHGCSKYDETEVLNSIQDCDSSLNGLQYSPPVPLWTIEGVSALSIPDDLSLREKVIVPGVFSLPGDFDANNTCSAEYNVVHTDSNLKLEIPCEELKNASADTVGYLAELSNSLLNFSPEDDILFMDDNGEDVIDKSYYEGLSTLLLSSPNDANQDDMRSIPEQDSLVNPDNLRNQASAYLGDLDEKRGACLVSDTVSSSEVQVLTPASSASSYYPGLDGGVISCLLNTEDIEIPNNDHVDFKKHLQSYSSIAKQPFRQACVPNSLSRKELTSSRKKSGGQELLQRDLENPGPYPVSSKMARSQLMLESGMPGPVGDHGVNFGVPSSDSTGGSGVSAQNKPANISTEIHTPAKLKEQIAENAFVKLLSHKLIDTSTENKSTGAASDKYHSHTNASGIKQEPGVAATAQNHQASSAMVRSTEVAASASVDVANHSKADPEEPHVESDDDVLYFSDIEAMILDMDLDPEDHNLFPNEEVLRYQRDDVRRTIIRLEQGAHSYIQRAIASHGAFAILYGRHSRHYIKKAEVLLGRGTEDSVVDIDLGREGRANKISRRQASIHLDRKGIFHLKNLGKFSILVNDKEIGTGLSTALTESCLIEIRGLPFIFEINQLCVRRYLDSITQNNNH